MLLLFLILSSLQESKTTKIKEAPCFPPDSPKCQSRVVTARPTCRPTSNPTGSSSSSPTSNPTISPTSQVTTSPPTNQVTESPTNQVTTSSPTQAPTEPISCVKSIYQNPQETFSRSPGINSTCQLTANNSLTCLTFDDLIILNFSVQISSYRNYSLASEGQIIGSTGVIILNNTLTPEGNFSSTWPNYVISGDYFWVIYANTSFNLLSLTIAPIGTIAFVTIWGRNSEGIYTYIFTIFNFMAGPNLIVLNWANVTTVKISPASSILAIDSLVVTQLD
jgi:hypothetical protein